MGTASDAVVEPYCRASRCGASGSSISARVTRIRLASRHPAAQNSGVELALNVDARGLGGLVTSYRVLRLLLLSCDPANGAFKEIPRLRLRDAYYHTHLRGPLSSPPQRARPMGIAAYLRFSLRSAADELNRVTLALAVEGFPELHVSALRGGPLLARAVA